jgi:hypothetical protein
MLGLQSKSASIVRDLAFIKKQNGVFLSIVMIVDDANNKT